MGYLFCNVQQSPSCHRVSQEKERVWWPRPFSEIQQARLTLLHPEAASPQTSNRNFFRIHEIDK